MITWKEAEKVYLIELIRTTYGDFLKASEVSGLSITTIYNKVKALDLQSIVQEARDNRKNQSERGH